MRSYLQKIVVTLAVHLAMTVIRTAALTFFVSLISFLSGIVLQLQSYHVYSCLMFTIVVHLLYLYLLSEQLETTRTRIEMTVRTRWESRGIGSRGEKQNISQTALALGQVRVLCMREVLTGTVVGCNCEEVPDCHT